MKFLAISQLDSQEQEYEASLQEDTATLFSLLDSGRVHSMYWKMDNSGSVLIFDADSVEAANEMLETLPSVQRGITRFDLTEITPVWERSGDVQS